MDLKSIHRFIRLTQITLIFVYLVIIAGTVVRATGSGMGCPDWPKCFGKFVPPTDVSQLPENYKELYAGEHNAVAEFNALKTWTEYINRLFGAVLGLLVFVQLLFSIKLRKVNKQLFNLSLVEFILIGFQGWLGAKVVSSNLAPVKITVHMLVALLILAVGIIIIHKAKKLVSSNGVPASTGSMLKNLSIIVLIVSIIQIMLGTQVREEVDVLLKNVDNVFRDQVILMLSNLFKIHRSFSILLLLLNAWMVIGIIKGNSGDTVKKLNKWLVVCILAEVGIGISLSELALPPALQPMHLLLACIIYGLQYTIILKLWVKQV